MQVFTAAGVVNASDTEDLLQNLFLARLETKGSPVNERAWLLPGRCQEPRLTTPTPTAEAP